MNQIKEEVKELEEIHIKKMHFKVISRRPQYSKTTALKIEQDMQKELYDIFKKYL